MPRHKRHIPPPPIDQVEAQGSRVGVEEYSTLMRIALDAVGAREALAIAKTRPLQGRRCIR